MIDRHIDVKMERTQQRALVTGMISLRSAGLFAGILGTMGFVVLTVQTNALTFWVGVVAVFDYVVLYGYTKRRSVHGTLVGGIAGAAAITAGYTAVTNQLDYTAIILFFIMFAWQLPHFYAIALYRRADYRKANIPVLSVVKGTAFTQRTIMACIPLFAVVTMLLTAYGQASVSYLVVMLTISLWWFWIGLSRLKSTTPTIWGKSVFGSSLVVLLLFCLLISVDIYLP
jgi:protoheme IX farnesyltransferase